MIYQLCIRYDFGKKLSMKYDLAQNFDYHVIKYDGQNLSIKYDRDPPPINTLILLPYD